jgi:hypothetical protein
MTRLPRPAIYSRGPRFIPAVRDLFPRSAIYSGRIRGAGSTGSPFSPVNLTRSELRVSAKPVRECFDRGAPPSIGMERIRRRPISATANTAGSVAPGIEARQGRDAAGGSVHESPARGLARAGAKPQALREDAEVTVPVGHSRCRWIGGVRPVGNIRSATSQCLLNLRKGRRTLTLVQHSTRRVVPALHRTEPHHGRPPSANVHSAPFLRHPAFRQAS